MEAETASLTPLILAAANGVLDVVAILLRHPDEEIEQADWQFVNQRNNRGHTALWVATAFDHPKIVERLLARGGDVTIGSNEGVTPLMQASMTGRLHSVMMLISPQT